MDRQALLMSQYKKYNNVHLPVLAFLYFYIGKILGFVLYWWETSLEALQKDYIFPKEHCILHFQLRYLTTMCIK